MTNAEILKKIEELNVHKVVLSKVLKLHHADVYNAIFENTAFLDVQQTREIKFQERLYCIRNDIKSKVLCVTCKRNPVKFKGDCNEYARHCSLSCADKDKSVIALKKKTKKKKYGNENYIGIDKARKTRAMKNNGKWHAVDFAEKCSATAIKSGHQPFWHDEEKRKKTCMKTYGVDHPLKNKETVEKSKQKFAKNHNGIACALQLPKVIERTKIGNRKKSWRCILRNPLVQPNFTLEEYLKVEDLNQKDCLEFKCKKCGTVFRSKWDNGCCKPCPTCYPELHGMSHSELEVLDWLKTLNLSEEYDLHSRDSINNSLLFPKRLDIVVEKDEIPAIAIEFDGLYWHSEMANGDKNSQLHKTEKCEEKNIQLIHIFENEWLCKQDIVKSRLKNLLGIYDKIVFARKCEVREVLPKDSIEFQEENHIQGAVGAKVHLGLFYEDELVSIMTFGKSRFSKKVEWELLRFCNKLGYHVPGGAGKLLKHFERNWHPKSLISYADRRWSRGKLYEALGFKLDHVSKPDYWYLKPSNPTILYRREKFQKRKLKKQLEFFNETMSEVENMRNNGYTRIFDCGNLVFMKTY